MINCVLVKKPHGWHSCLRGVLYPVLVHCFLQLLPLPSPAVFSLRYPSHAAITPFIISLFNYFHHCVFACAFLSFHSEEKGDSATGRSPHFCSFSRIHDSTYCFEVTTSSFTEPSFHLIWAGTISVRCFPGTLLFHQYDTLPEIA